MGMVDSITGNVNWYQPRYQMDMEVSTVKPRGFSFYQTTYRALTRDEEPTMWQMQNHHHQFLVMPMLYPDVWWIKCHWSTINPPETHQKSTKMPPKFDQKSTRNPACSVSVTCTAPLIVLFGRSRSRRSRRLPKRTLDLWLVMGVPENMDEHVGFIVEKNNLSATWWWVNPSIIILTIYYH